MLLEELSDMAANLRMMGDADLKVFADTHKADPYMLALALSESNQRQRQRQNAAQSMQPIKPVPTVADQKIQQMAAGLPTLPARNLETMNAAVGGIVGDDYDMAVGYAGGGMVERYQVGGLPPTAGSPYAIPGLIQGSTPLVPGQEGAPENTPLLQRLLAGMRETGSRYQLAEARKRIEMGVGTAADHQIVRAAAEAGIDMGPPLSAAPATTPAAKPQAPSGAPAAAAAAAAQQAAPTTPQPPREAPAKTTAAPGISGLDVKKLYESFQPKGEVVDPFARQRKELADAETKAAEQTAADIERDRAARGTAFADREARLKKREEKLTSQEGDLKGMALFEAGLAVLAGDSPNALQNIGRGAMVGAKSYKQGMKDIEDGREKLDDAFSRIEEFRRNESMMDDKEKRAAQAEIRKVRNAGLRSLIDGAEKAYGLQREDAKTMFTGAVQQQVAQIGASATLGAAQVRAGADRAWMEDVQSARALETVRKNLKDQITKAMPYATEQEREAAFQRQWPEVLRMNPNLAKYAGAPGGGGAASQSDPLGILGKKP